jgi:hypothetical protein
MPGRITDELRRITREQGGGDPGAAPAPESSQGSRSPGRYGPIAALVVVAVVACLGWWLVQKLQADSKLQDCVMSGRKNCTEPATDPR